MRLAPLLSRCHARSFCAAFILAAGATACGPAEPFGDEPVGSDQWPVHTVCGSGNEVEGIDVSKWQGSIDWAGVKQAGVVFAIVRATHGTGTIDEFFDANWKGAKANGIVRGVYQYFDPGSDPIAQAKLLVDMVDASGGFEPGDLPAVIDVESTDGLSASAITANVRAWIDYVEAATSRRPIVYSGSYFWDDNGLDGSFASYPLWTAHYTTNPCPLTSSAWAKWTFWQYTDSGSVTGIGGNVDRDVFDGTPAEFQQFIADSTHSVEPPDAGEQDAASQVDAPEEGSTAVEPDAGVDAGEPDAAEDDGPAQDADQPGDDAAREPAVIYLASVADESPCGCRAAGQGSAPSRGTMALAALALAACWVRLSRRGSGAAG